MPINIDQLKAIIGDLVIGMKEKDLQIQELQMQLQQIIAEKEKDNVNSKSNKN